MYIILNKTTKTTLTHEGSFPLMYLEGLLNLGDDLIVISLYSNTVKIPYFEVRNGEKEWDYKEYHINPDIFKTSSYNR